MKVLEQCMTKINMKLNWYYYKQQQKTFKDRTENQQKVLSTLMSPLPPQKKNTKQIFKDTMYNENQLLYSKGQKTM